MIKNWKLLLLGLFFTIVFALLGIWQVSRAHEKQHLLQAFHARTKNKPLTANEMITTKDLRFYRATLTGTFDNAHTFLLDNKIMHGVVGYEVYTPFHAKGLPLAILIDRGFVPIGKDRKILPRMDLIVGNITLTGLLNLPPYFRSYGKIFESTTPSWPLRVEYLNLKEIADILHYPLNEYSLTLEPKHPAGYEIEWQIVIMGPERHMGYAVQWFALSITMLILSVVLFWRSNKKRG